MLSWIGLIALDNGYNGYNVIVLSNFVEKHKEIQVYI